ncbi:hypothetical protein CPB85DRAFT_1257244 [Mucidula mucida]|nr:hypothetical protein CPB85DRAFT_1257244 [Mucidula mucida]
MSTAQQLQTEAVQDVYNNNLIGFTLATTFYGATVLQTFVYYRSFFKKDRWMVQCLVVVLSRSYWTPSDTSHSVLNTLGTALVTAAMIEDGVRNVVIFISQMHVQSQSVFCLLPSPVLRVSAVDCFWKSVSSYTTHRLIYRDVKFVNPRLVALTVLSDNIIRGTIKGLSALDDSLLRAQTIIDKIIKYAACRATVTFAQVVYFITLLKYTAFPRRTYRVPVHQILSKIYINSVLASLQKLNDVTCTLSSLKFTQTGGRSVEIIVSRDVERDSDVEGMKFGSGGQIKGAQRSPFRRFNLSVV